MGWKKAFYKTLSVNIPSSAFQCLQTPVTQDGSDESLRQVQFNQMTNLHPAMHTVPRCHGKLTLNMGVCHDHSNPTWSVPEHQGSPGYRPSTPWAQKLTWSYRQLISDTEETIHGHERCYLTGTIRKRIEGKYSVGSPSYLQYTEIIYKSRLIQTPFPAKVHVRKC